MGTDYTKDIDFIEKRIEEQRGYNKDLCYKHATGKLEDKRFNEVYDSSVSQFYYFINLRDQYYESENKLSTI